MNIDPRLSPAQRRARCAAEILTAVYKFNGRLRHIRRTQTTIDLFLDELSDALDGQSAANLDAQPISGFSPGEVEQRVVRAMTQRLPK